jgi:hypothetical protein
MLNEWLKELQKLEHQPPGEYDVTIGCGSQDLLAKVSP